MQPLARGDLGKQELCVVKWAADCANPTVTILTNTLCLFVVVSGSKLLCDMFLVMVSACSYKLNYKRAHSRHSIQFLPFSSSSNRTARTLHKNDHRSEEHTSELQSLMRI